MPVPNFTLVGSPYTNPNWIAPGLGQTPYSPYLLSNGGNVAPVSGGQIVQYTPKGLVNVTPVATASPTAGLNPVIDLGKINPAAAASPAEEVVKETAKKGGKVGKALKGAGKGAKALGKIALPLTIATSPMMADPGSKVLGDGTLSANARMLDLDPNDTGVEDLAKSWMRGNYNIMEGLAGLGSDAYDAISYLWTPHQERAIADKAKKGQELFEQAKAQGATHEQANAIRDAFLQGQLDGQGQPLPSVQAADEAAYGIPQGQGDTSSPVFGLGGGDYTVPAGRNPEISSALHGLLGVVAAGKPTKASPLSQNMKDKLAALAFSKAIDIPEDYSQAAQFRRASDALMSADINTYLQQQQQEAEYAKSMLDWAEKYAKTGLDVAKLEKDLGKSDMKIHSTRGGFLVQTTDAEGNTSLKPVSADIFGKKSTGKIVIGDNKFDADSPLSHELGILQNLGQIGALDSVLNEYSDSPEMKEIVKANLGDAKKAKEAQLIFLASVAYKNPQFKSKLVKAYTDFMGKAPKGVTLTEAPTSFTDALLNNVQDPAGSDAYNALFQ